MSIDPKTLGQDDVVECKTPGHWKMAHSFMACMSVSRAYVPVPEGMSVEDANQALADHAKRDEARIDRMARTLHDADDPQGQCAAGGREGCMHRDKYRAAARAALAVVREHEAGTR